MRILYVCPYYTPADVYGGPVRCLADSCAGLAEAGAEVTVFTTDANGDSRLAVPLGRPVGVDGVAVHYFPLALNGLSYFYSPSLAVALNARVVEFDLVAVACLWGHALPAAAAACARFGVPYVVSVHGQLFPWSLAKGRLKKWLYLELLGRRCLDRAAAIHCTDPVEARAVARLGFRAPTFVAPNPLRACCFCRPQDAGPWRRRLGIPDGALVLLFLGRLARIKRPDIAVDVLGVAQALDREVHLVLVGPDEDGLRRELVDQAQALGCAGKLHFTGLVDREAVALALQGATMLLMPSEVQENFGMSALEAMAAGVPILVSDGVPLGRRAEEVGAGRVLPCTKPAFRQATMELLARPDQLKAMGERGRDFAGRYLDAPVVARQLLAQYGSIVATGKPLPRAEDYGSPR